MPLWVSPGGLSKGYEHDTKAPWSLLRQAEPFLWQHDSTSSSQQGWTQAASKVAQPGRLTGRRG